jgi:hypothetical protein
VYGWRWRWLARRYGYSRIASGALEGKIVGVKVRIAVSLNSCNIPILKVSILEILSKSSANANELSMTFLLLKSDSDGNVVIGTLSTSNVIVILRRVGNVDLDVVRG